MGCGRATSYGGPQLSRQSPFTHGKTSFITAKSISSRQNQFRPRQNQFRPRQNTFHHGKIHFTTAKSFSLSRSRDISSQSAIQHGGVARGFMTQQVLLKLGK